MGSTEAMPVTFNDVPELLYQLTIKIDGLQQQIATLEAKASGTSDRSLLNMGQVSELLGQDSKTIYKLVHNKKIPYHKAPGGRRLYFDRDEIINWVKGQQA